MRTKNLLQIVFLKDIVTQVNPGFPTGQHNSMGDGVLHFRPMNIGSDGIVNLNVKKFVQPPVNYQPLREGDIVFNNTNSPELLGKTTLIHSDTDWAFSNHMTRIRLQREKADPEYVAWYLHSLFWEGFFKANCSNHVNQASISKSFLLERVGIPLPDLQTQKLISRKIEESFSELNAGGQGLENILASLKTLRASALGSIFGNLKNPGIKKVPLTAILREALKNGNSSKETSDPAGIPTLTLSAVTQGDFSLKNVKRTVADRNKIKDLWLEKGDILIERSNTPELVGISKTYEGESGYAIFPDLLIRIRPDKGKIMTNFLQAYLDYLYLSGYFKKHARGTSNTMPKINQGILESVQIPLICLEEQHEIMAKIDAVMSQVTFSQSLVLEQKARINGLKKSIFLKFFSINANTK